MSVTGNTAERVRKCREKKIRLGLERMEISLDGDLLDKIREEAAYQGVPSHRLIEAILANHFHSGKRVWV